VHYVSFDTAEDLILKVRYYLTMHAEDERLQIAPRAGWKQAMTHYISRNLVEAMLFDNMKVI
jgi:hypothetical protein